MTFSSSDARAIDESCHLTMYSKARRRRIRRNPRYIRPLAALIAKFGFMKAERRITLKDKFSKLFSMHNIKYDIRI
jgi:hypothetical protein